MDLSDIMQQKTFLIVGNTRNKEKYAYQIKQAMIEHGYQVYDADSVQTMSDVPDTLDVIDLCIRADRGLEILQACEKKVSCVVVQPGASSEALVGYLEGKQIPYIHGCLLQGLRLYRN